MAEFTSREADEADTRKIQEELNSKRKSSEVKLQFAPMLMDVTIRDGGYVLGWDQPVQYVRDLIRAAVEARIPYVEIGFLNKRETDSGFWDALNEGLVNSVIHEDSRSHVMPKLVAMVDYGKQDLSDWYWVSQIIDVVRIATPFETVEAAFNLASEIKSAFGVDCCVNVMRLSTLNPQQVYEVGSLASKYRPWCTYLADSFGACFPHKVTESMKILRYTMGTQLKMGFHAHDNLNLAFANSLVAVEAGADLIDCSIAGVGRGGGNLETELAVGHWVSPEYLDSIIKFYYDWIHHDVDHVYDPLPLATAFRNAHPNYATAEPGIDCKQLLYRLSLLSPLERQKYLKHAFNQTDNSDY